MTIAGAVLATIAAGYLGDALIGVPMNWPDVGAVFAVATMGAFILRALNRKS